MRPTHLNKRDQPSAAPVHVYDYFHSRVNSERVKAKEMAISERGYDVAKAGDYKCHHLVVGGGGAME